MKKRVKDLAFALKLKKKELEELARQLDENEQDLYRNWDEPKTDEFGDPRYDTNGKLLTRPINAPTKRLKSVQSRILKKVLYKIELPDYYFGGIKGKDAVKNARFHQGNKYFFLTDLKDFYPSVSAKSLEKALRLEGFYPDVSRIITRLCTRGGCIPQGCPTSSFLASLVVHHNCAEVFEKYIADGLKVSIYVDDITFSSPYDFKDKAKGILEDLRTRGLKINFDKTHYCTFNPTVTGVHVKNNGISPLPYNFDRLREKSRDLNSKNGYFQRIKYIKRIAKEGILRKNKKDI